VIKAGRRAVFSDNVVNILSIVPADISFVHIIFRNDLHHSIAIIKWSLLLSLFLVISGFIYLVMNINLDLEMNESLISIAVSNTYILYLMAGCSKVTSFYHIYSNFCSRDEKEKF